MIPFIHMDVAELLKAIGYIGMFVIVFAESGLFFGFFLPGGSMLFTAGLLASQGYFNIYILVVVLGLAAVVGDSVGYWFGRQVGPRIFNRPDSKFFSQRNLQYSKEFYDKYGAQAVVLGRFVPIARTFIPILAGVGQMDYRKFLGFNILGALAWAVGVSLLGYFLGATVPGIDKYILPIIILIVFLSVLPIIIRYFGEIKRLWKKQKEQNTTRL